MRRLFGPCGGAARQGISVAADTDASSDVETDFEDWVAGGRRKKVGKEEKGKQDAERRKKRWGRRTEDGDEKKSENKVEGGWRQRIPSGAKTTLTGQL